MAIRDALKRAVKHEIESRKQFLIHEFSKQFHLFQAMLFRVGDQILHELFGEIHVAGEIAKRHLRLDHPEFTGVSRSV